MTDTDRLAALLAPILLDTTNTSMAKATDPLTVEWATEVAIARIAILAAALAPTPPDALDVERLAEAWANVMDGRRIGAASERIGRDTTTPEDWDAIAREYVTLAPTPPDAPEPDGVACDWDEHGRCRCKAPTPPDAPIGVEEAVARGQSMLAASEAAADREITRLNARIVALNAEVLDRMDQWHRDSLARDELARQQNREIARLRRIEAAARTIQKDHAPRDPDLCWRNLRAALEEKP